MNISVSRELEELVRRKLASGHYDSAAQLLEEALLLLDERDQLRALRRERLVGDIAAGLFEADNRHLVEADEVFTRLLARAGVADE